MYLYVFMSLYLYVFTYFHLCCFHPNGDQYGNICLDILKVSN